MNSSIISKLKNLHLRYKEIELLLSNHQLDMDVKQLCNLSKEYFQLSNINKYFIQWKNIKDELKSIKTLLNDSELCSLAEKELKAVLVKKSNLENKIKKYLLPNNNSESKSCFIEIRAATGGDEAAIFARDLFKMYIRYSELKSWKTEIINVTHGIKGGGFKDVIIKVTGKDVCMKLKFESGGHRVQRIPKTESQGRVHTSTCTVAVIPVAPKKDIEKLNLSDLKIDTFRSSGAGGQHVNTTDSAIRITHIPTGQVVECQDERSQHKNKAKALSVLVSRIQAAELNHRREIDSNMRRGLIGTGARSDRNRTYNFPQNRVTDHRINLVLYCLDEILNGKLDSLIEPIIQENQVNKLSNYIDVI